MVCDNFSDYIGKVIGSIKWKKTRSLIEEELRAHLEESSAERMAAGMGEKESQDDAIEAMGDPQMAGGSLNGLYRPRMDWVFAACALCLMLLAALVMPLWRWGLSITGVIVLYIVFNALDFSDLLKKRPMLLMACGIVAFISVLVFGREINGRKILPPMEVIGILLCLFGASGTLNDGRNVRSIKGAFPVLALAMLAGLIVLLFPHFSLLVLFGLAGFAIMLRSSLPKPLVWALIIIPAALIALSVLQAQYRLDRIVAPFAVWFAPESADISSAGYQPYIIMNALKRTALIGNTAAIVEPASWLSEQYPLLYIAVLVGRLPMYGAIIANAILCWRMFAISKKLTDRLSSCLAYGLSTYVAAVSLFGVLTNLGVFFITAQALFLAESGSSWLIQGVCVVTVFTLNRNRDFIRLKHGCAEQAMPLPSWPESKPMVQRVISGASDVEKALTRWYNYYYSNKESVEVTNMALNVKPVTDQAFKKYGQVVSGYDFSGIIETLKGLPCPDDSVLYKPSEPTLESNAAYTQLADHYFGGMPIQIGYCCGFNTKLNCLEYHRDSEVNIAATGFIALLGTQELITNGLFDTKHVEAFFIPAGTAVEFFATALHYAPCSKEQFRVAVVLPRGTNTEKPDFKPINDEDVRLTARNKWLYPHPDSAEAKGGAKIGLVGENLDITK